MASIVKVNVGGTEFQTTYSTLVNSGCSRLIEEMTRTKKSDAGEITVFFDQNPYVFEAILDYFRSGKLHIPRNVCAELMKDGLKFWDISEANLSPCCWREFYSTEETFEALEDLERYLEENSDNVEIKTTRKRMWRFLEDPSSSRAAKIWNYFYLFLVFMTFVSQCLMSHSLFRKDYDPHFIAEVLGRTNITNPKFLIYTTSYYPKEITWCVRLCFAVFTIEFLLRFITCTNKYKFIKKASNAIEVAIHPATWIMSYLEEFKVVEILTDTSYLVIYCTLYSIAVLRLLRFFRLAKHLSGLRVLLLAIKASTIELVLLLVSFCIGVFIYAAFVYACEFTNTDTFSNMFVAMWWAVVTMTTVGYGDETPKTLQGRVVGCLCALSGLLLIAMPVAIIANNFGTRYNLHKYRRKIKSAVTTKTPRSTNNGNNSLKKVALEELS